MERYTTRERQTRGSNQYFETYVDTMRSNNILLNRIMDHIQVSERTMRSQLEHSRSIDRQLFNAINVPRERPVNSFTRRNPVNFPRQTFDWDSLSLTPVVIRPSQAHIRRATTNLLFREIDNPSNLLCPITQQPFESHDNVTIIDHCRHIFSRNELAEWFDSNVRCPVCRFDIREHTIESSSNTDVNRDNQTQESEETTNNSNALREDEDIDASTERHILNSLAESINSEIARLTRNESPRDEGVSDREFVMDPSGNLTYRFTLRPGSGSNPGNN